MKPLSASIAGLAFVLVGCASSLNDPATGATSPSSERLAQDRAAILAMTGDYDVTFHFEESVALADGYELKPIKDSGGRETVFVIEDTGELIRLQHVLVVGPSERPIVVKHWRQDWRYEPARIVEYVGHDQWRGRNLAPADVAGQWSQTVYQVDDSPRYAAVAAWTHGADGVSTWESPVSWRPLPRRDATTRDDYNVMQAVNRHTITPWGWSHEQDNEKILVAANGDVTALVREVGVNSYRAADEFPMAPVTAYWDNTAEFWQVVRDRWDALEADSAVIHIDGREPDNPIYGPILAVVQQLDQGDKTVEAAVADFDAILQARVSVDGNIPDHAVKTTQWAASQY